MKIKEVVITPIAVPDQPLLNTKGIQQPVYLRSVIEIKTDQGNIGLGESYGAQRTLTGLLKVAPTLTGMDPFDLHDLRRRVDHALPDGGGINAPTMLTDHQLTDVVYSAFEIPCLDLIGKKINRRVCEILGGAVRNEISFSGYLFYKFAKQNTDLGPDMFGTVMTPDALVDQAKVFVGEHGFQSLKLKGGVLEPDLEIETLRKLRETFPHHQLRIDPMGAWTVPTAKYVVDALNGLLEYLEDPCRGMDAMAELAEIVDIPLATNLVVVELEQIFEAVNKRAVNIILGDHHYWCGATGAVRLNRICQSAGLGLSMHSNSHLGISLAAMCHVAAACPHLTFDCDTHYPWCTKEIIKHGQPKFREGCLRVPDGPGLGVELDYDALSELSDLYKQLDIKDRDDTSEILKYVPDYVRKVPRW